MKKDGNTYTAEDLYALEKDIFTGSKLTSLNDAKIRQYAEEIHAGLIKYPFLMRQFSIKNLIHRMRLGLFILNIHNDHLLSCAQVWKESKNTLEIGTWLKFANGKNSSLFTSAQITLLYALSRAREINSAKKIIAVIRQNNIPANKSILSLNALHTGIRLSRYVKDEHHRPAVMNVYDLTDL